jgi:carboxyl-terminal processing protease
MCAGLLRLGFVFCCLSRLAAGQVNPGQSLTLEERVFTASKVFSLLQSQFFSARTETAPVLDGSYRNYLRKILVTDDRLAFDAATMEFVAQIHNGHTFFWDEWLDKSDNQALGFYAMPLDGKWVVQTSFLDSLNLGDVISSIDNATMESFFQQHQRYISASSIAAQRHNLFLFPYLFPEQFTLTLQDGRKVLIKRETLKKPQEETEGRWLKPGAIAYIRIPAFFYPHFEQRALDFVGQFRNAKVLIVDVRRNGGGIPPARLVEALIDRPHRGWAESTSVRLTTISAVQVATKNSETDQGVDESQGVSNALINSLGNSESNRGSRVVMPSQNAFRGRLILLVDGGCVSACEDFVEPSKDSGRATLIGETTQGSSGLPFFYDFHNGMSIKIAVKRDYFPDGSEFEGVGIKPDIEVHTTIEDLKNGRDPVLEKALELASKP